MEAAVVPDQDTFVDVDGARLRVRTAGNGPVLVLLHGWALDLDIWSLQFAELARHARVIAFDRRGFGLSSGQPSVEQDVDDLQQVLDRFEVERPVLVGMSQGARVVLRHALKHPSRAAAIVLDGAPAEHPELLDATWEQDISDYRELVAESGLGAFREAWSFHPFLRLHSGSAASRSVLEAVIRRCPASALSGPHVPSALVGERLPTLQQPALVLVGEYDSARRHEVGETLASALPNGSLQKVLNAGHLSALDAPGTYTQLLVDTLRRHA